MKKIVILLSVVISLLFSSCLKMDDFQIVGIDKVNMQSLSKFEIEMELRNDSRRNVKIVSAKLDLMQGESHILSLMINEKIIIPRRSIVSLSLPIHVKLRKPFLAAMVVQDLDRHKNTITISGEVKAKVGLITKKFTFKDMPISQFIDTFGDQFNF